MVLPPMSSAVGSIARRKPRIDAAVEQPGFLANSQCWRGWVINHTEVDPARAQYVDELLAKRREAGRG
jgi:hypothetical protein